MGCQLPLLCTPLLHIPGNFGFATPSPIHRLANGNNKSQITITSTIFKKNFKTLIKTKVHWLNLSVITFFPISK